MHDGGDRMIVEGAAQHVDVAHVAVDAGNRPAGELGEARQHRAACC